MPLILRPASASRVILRDPNALDAVVVVNEFPSSTAQWIFPKKIVQRQIALLCETGRFRWRAPAVVLRLAPVVTVEPLERVIKVKGRVPLVAAPVSVPVFARVIVVAPQTHEELDAAMSVLPTELEKMLPELYEDSRRAFSDWWGYEIDTVSTGGSGIGGPRQSEVDLAKTRAIIARALKS